MKRESKFHVVIFEIINEGNEVTREVQVAEATGGPNVVARAMEAFAIDMGVIGYVEVEHKEPRRKKPKGSNKKSPKIDAEKEDTEVRSMLANPQSRSMLESMLGKDAMDGIEKLMAIHDVFAAQPGKADQS